MAKLKHNYLMSLVKGKAEQAIKGYFDDPNKYEKLFKEKVWQQ